MEAPSLENAWAKLEWAGQHFKGLRTEIETFEEAHNYRISVESDLDAGEYLFRIHDVQPVNPLWGLRIGDVVHNARTALDYLVVNLWAHITGQDPRTIGDIQFPVFDDPGRYKGAVKEMGTNLAFRGYLTRIEELQPFNNGNPSIWGLGPWNVPKISAVPSALQRLSDLDNVDKHRVIHAAWNGVAWHLSPSLPSAPGHELDGGSTYGGPLENGAEVGRARVRSPLPSTWRPTELEMKRHFPLEVSLDEPLPMKGVLEVLPFCLWAVSEVLTLFDPVFASGSPPLPVTTIVPSPLETVRQGA